ncbi:hypothetical protein TELCIR_05651, partial [Teladorsagia circumcincta]
LCSHHSIPADRRKRKVTPETTERLFSKCHPRKSPTLYLLVLAILVQFASTYMVLCATMERFIVVAEIHSLQSLVRENGRYLTIGVVIVCVLGLRVPAFFEYVIAFRPECPIYMSYDYVPWLAGWEHYQIFNFYVMTVLHVFVPFAILVILNISIVALTKRKLHGVSWAMTTLIDMPKISATDSKAHPTIIKM